MESRNEKMCRKWQVTVQIGEESESGIRKWEEMWFEATAEDGERWGQQWRGMEDGSTDELLRQETLCHRQWTDDWRVRRTSRDVDEASAWHECLLVDVVRHAGTLAPDHDDICTPKQQVKSAEQRADVVELRRREYQPGGCIHYRLKSLKKIHRNDYKRRVTEIQPRNYAQRKTT